jgi:hypothetical protein
MEEATDGLAAQNMLAEGGYRVIYKGVLRDSTAVAAHHAHQTRRPCCLRR